MEKKFNFEIVHRSSVSNARVGKIYTPHGIIDTPNFVAVGTNATLKAIDSKMVDSLGLQLMFCNTYHLMLHPGTQIIKSAGGLHSYMNRLHPIITDSGGFQVFSLAYGTVKDELKSRGKKKGDSAVLKVSEEGITFRSYRDGSKIFLTPESSVQAQKELGADIIIPLDELPPYHIDENELRKSFDRTHRWQERSMNEHLKNPNNQAMYAVIHGGINNELRLESVKNLSQHPFDGFAIGGSLGKNRDEMIKMLKNLMPNLPENKPNHLLGIGDLASLEPSIRLGIDTFDSSHPTRCARHGLLFTFSGPIKILQMNYKSDFSPIDPKCYCYTCTHYTRSYLHHLFKAKELTSYTLSTIHNIFFMVQLFKSYREKILNNQI